MPEDVKNIYLEASGIVNQSPRAAVALLRLAVQMLMKHIGEKGKKIDDDIKVLVEKGLPEEIQQALDSLRVIGNNAVHPGEITLVDDYDSAISLFQILNYIIHYFISTKKLINQVYEKLPEKAKSAIENRDKKTTPVM
ncbi:DUF4145 domain-containing protein [Brevibacillus porteri]|uniref:DUF4145 domain-containing protein n=1 Tax=Brevibacillus porteri TaxID=2126350 RepID=UPI003D23CAFD